MKISAVVNMEVVSRTFSKLTNIARPQNAPLKSRTHQPSPFLRSPPKKNPSFVWLENMGNLDWVALQKAHDRGLKREDKLFLSTKGEGMALEKIPEDQMARVLAEQRMIQLVQGTLSNMKKIELLGISWTKG
jgi:hypothetical protein